MSISYRVLVGDVLECLRELPDESVNCVVTSPPYWGLRDYGMAGQIGLEKTPQEFIAKLTEVFREVRRVLRNDGTCWVNMGDSYARKGGTQGGGNRKLMHLEGKQKRMGTIPDGCGLKEKDLVGMPWRLAFALQDDGWWLRQDIIWSKPNPMPESVTDRCTKAHEYLFLLTKSAKYHYESDAIKEAAADSSLARWDQDVENQHGSERVPGKTNGTMKAVGGRAAGNKTHKTVVEYEASDSEQHRTAAGLLKIANTAYAMRNKRSVWEIATQRFSEAHFATFPRKLVEPCIRAGCPAGGVVLDPFNGSGTTGLVAMAERCSYIGIELNPEYAAMAERRLAAATAQGVLAL